MDGASIHKAIKNKQQSVQKSSFTSSASSAASTQVKSILKQPASVKHGEEIQQETLKSTIQSAITDIEQGMPHVLTYLLI